MWLYTSDELGEYIEILNKENSGGSRVTADEFLGGRSLMQG